MPFYTKQHVCPKQQIPQNSHLFKLLYYQQCKRWISGIFHSSYIVVGLSLYLISVKGPILIRCFHQVCLMTHLLIQNIWVSHEGSSSEEMEEHRVRKEVGLMDQPWLWEGFLHKPLSTPDVSQKDKCCFKG